MSSDLRWINRICKELLADVDREFSRVRDMFLDRMRCC